MASRKEARGAVAEDLRALADDLKALLEDPKKRKRRERQWNALYGGIAIVTTLVGRRLAAKAWGILTGEPPPIKGAAATQQQQQQQQQQREKTPA
ncbi:MAG: hypothetical protein ACJ74X_07980 [Gaiellaceae bacterium]